LDVVAGGFALGEFGGEARHVEIWLMRRWKEKTVLPIPSSDWDMEMKETRCWP
jgi:hypothetical protein